MKKRLGCLTPSGLVTALLVIAAIGVSLWVWGGAMFSPGPLNAQAESGPLGGVAAHADLSHNCSACHPAPWSRQTLSDRCQDCHQNVTAELSDPATLHGALYTDRFRPCQECHTDHNGPDALLTIVDSGHFPHEATGYRLEAHQQMSTGETLACADCHPAELTSFQVSTCDTCHRDLDLAFTSAHVDAFGRNCLACHDGLDSFGAAWSHNQTTFPLLGAHTNSDCAACHRAQQTLVALQATDPACVACHQKDDAHAGQFGNDCAACHSASTWEETTFSHALTNFPLLGGHETVECEQCHRDNVFAGTPTDCAACHQKDDVHAGGLGRQCEQCHTTTNWTQSLFSHALTNFPLLGAHKTAACVDCHLNNVFDNTSTTCYGCHQQDDAHKGQFGEQCDTCHAVDTWAGALFDHTATGFPLAGAHAQTACEQCHINNVFAGTPTDCYSCHAKDDKHQGQFGRDCAACHTTANWPDATFDHNLTVFPLTGAHTQTACEQCHLNNIYKGTPTTCYGCHQQDDAHAGQFGEQCDACHTTSAWQPASYNGPHPFPMNHGQRDNSPCATCHPDSLTSYTCYGCHEHTAANIAGEHREEGITNFEDCVACHPTGREEGD